MDWLAEISPIVNQMLNVIQILVSLLTTQRW
jgi:hypothetical protein